MKKHFAFLQPLRGSPAWPHVLRVFALLAFAGGARAANELIFLSGLEDCALAFADVDGDAWGDELRGTDNCTRPASYVVNLGDCNDGEPTVHPGAPDAPDASFADANCDGIDGAVARAAFVMPGGVDGPACSMRAPCATITHALARVAADGARDHVYVQAGQYAGQVDLVASEAVFGGFDASWMRADRNAPGHASVIQGGVRANGIVASAGNAPMLENLFVLGPDGVGAGASSIAVSIVASSGVVLARVRVASGSGGAGTVGTTPPPQPMEGKGGDGLPGCQDSSGFCRSCSRPAGGLSGTSTCGRIGGVGGLPGHASSGGSLGGVGVVGTPGGPGATCGGARTCDGTQGNSGLPGNTGASGGSGSAIGVFAGSEYVVANGVSGAMGTPGNGGGGGGGGGGGENSCDSYGSSGGGGGGGGCGGMPGPGGGGGGASIGVLLIDSSVAILDSVVIAGSGGIGGDGASGGAAGIGGAPGNGGPYGGGIEQDDAGDGAAGGQGGDGGRGGGGGGGGGGPAIGVVCAGTSTAQLTGTLVSAGSAGAGGTGGAPNGPAGSAGLALPVYNCPSN